MTMAGKSLTQTCAKLSILLVSFVWSFPVIGRVARCGLDNSWMYAINIMHSHGLCFGRDVIFTYGPFGYLLCPMSVGNNLEQAFWVMLVLHIIILALLSWVVLTRLSVFESLAVLLAGVVVSHGLQGSVLLIVVLLCGLALSVRRGRTFLVVPAVVLSVLVAFVKFSAGLSAGGICFMMLLFFIGDRDWRKLVYLSGVMFVAAASVLLVVSVLYLGGIRYLYSWLRGSLELSSGYCSALSQVGPQMPLVTAVLLLLVYVFAIVAYWWRVRCLAIYALVAPALFIAFKNGFVRADFWHFNEFFILSFAMLAACLPLRRTAAELRLGLFLCSMAMFAMLLCNTNHFRVLRTPASGWHNVMRAIHHKARFANIAEASAVGMSELKLDDAYVAELNSLQQTVDPIPWEMDLLAANDLQWSPSPLLQLFMTFNTDLDDLTAAHYAGESAADVLLFSYDVIDQRNLWWDSPATWRSILANYSYSPADSKRADYTVFRHKAHVAAVDMELIGSSVVELRQWNKIPESPGLVFAQLDLAPNLFGKLARILFRMPPIYAQLKFVSGKVVTYRVSPDVASNGLLMNHVPGNLSEFIDLFEGRSNNRVVSFRLKGPGLRYYGRQVAVQWRRLPYNLKYNLPRNLFRAETFHHFVGKLVSADADEAYLQAKGGVDSAGFMAFGRHAALCDGKYAAIFKIKCPAGEGGELLAQLDAVTDNGRRILGKADVYYAAGKSNAWQYLKVPFELTDKDFSNVEFRCRYCGAGTVLLAGIELIVE